MPRNRRKKNSTARSDLLVWLDAEMTGLDPLQDKLLEIAIIVTDYQFNEIARGEWLIHQDEAILKEMDPFCIRMHRSSGLWELSVTSTKTESQIQKEIIKFLSPLIRWKSCPLAGNSVHHDKAFLRTHMKKLHNYFESRVVDVSSFALIYRNCLGGKPVINKNHNHRAINDIEESITEMKQYMNLWLRIELPKDTGDPEDTGNPGD